MLGRPEGGLRHPERLAREFGRQLASAARGLRDAMPPVIRLHDLRHTHATLYLRAGVHPKLVSERLGHATISITLDVYSHAMPTMQREAAAQVAALIYGGTTSSASKYRRGISWCPSRRMLFHAAR